ncbi:MAG: DUF881 domain-containing protein [Syntrophothermus sp.]
MNNRSWQISVAIVCLILGLLLVVQIRTQYVKERAALPRTQFLVQLYVDAEEQRKALQKEVDQLRAELAGAAQGKSLTAALNTELEKARLLAGLTDVKGPGVIVVLDDSTAKPKPGQDADIFRIHDQDTLLVVNELFAAGAEALSINDQRHVATTEIRLAGDATSINNTHVGLPFTIKAIGNPATLEAALRMRGGVVDSLKTWGINVKIEQAQELVIPAYKGSLAFEYAKPLKPAAANPDTGGVGNAGAPNPVDAAQLPTKVMR